MAESRIIVALDFPDAPKALDFADRLDPVSCKLKVGKELFTAAGPQLVEQVMKRGFDVFLDLKFHDIPGTVANACKSAARLGVWMMNVHALGGRRMLAAAREAVPTGSSRVIAVTLLTSMESSDLKEIGLMGEPRDVVRRLALLAHECGLDGVVCSPLEVPELRRMLGTDFFLVTPGIRPAESATDEQRRISTPHQAVINGANYLVIGRPVTRASDPRAMLQRLNEEIGN